MKLQECSNICWSIELNRKVKLLILTNIYHLLCKLLTSDELLQTIFLPHTSLLSFVTFLPIESYNIHSVTQCHSFWRQLKTQQTHPFLSTVVKWTNFLIWKDEQENSIPSVDRMKEFKLNEPLQFRAKHFLPLFLSSISFRLHTKMEAFDISPKLRVCTCNLMQLLHIFR